MRGIALQGGEAEAFARAALALKYEPDATKPAPITAQQILAPQRREDMRPDLWSTFNRMQESLVRGGLDMRTTNGRRQRTREVCGASTKA